MGEREQKEGKFFSSSSRSRMDEKVLELDGNGRTGSDEAKEEIFKKNNVGLFVNACVWP